MEKIIADKLQQIEAELAKLPPACKRDWQELNGVFLSVIRSE